MKVLPFALLHRCPNQHLAGIWAVPTISLQLTFGFSLQDCNLQLIIFSGKGRILRGRGSHMEYVYLKPFEFCLTVMGVMGFVPTMLPPSMHFFLFLPFTHLSPWEIALHPLCVEISYCSKIEQSWGLTLLSINRKQVEKCRKLSPDKSEGTEEDRSLRFPSRSGSESEMLTFLDPLLDTPVTIILEEQNFHKFEPGSVKATFRPRKSLFFNTKCEVFF